MEVRIISKNKTSFLIRKIIMSDIPTTGTSQPVCCTTIKLELRKKNQHMEQPFSDTGKATQDFDSWEKNVVVHSPSCVRLFTTPCTAAREASLSLTISPSLPKFMSIESVMSSNYLILCHPLFLLPSIFPSIRVLPSESAVCIRQPKDWSFSFNISLSKEYSGFIFFKIDWFDLLPLQGTLKSLLQHTVQKHQLSGFFKV